MTHALDNSNGPQMNANEREFAFVRHYRPRPAVCPGAIGYADVRFGILPSQSGAGRTAFAGLQTRTPKAAHSASAMDGASNPFSGTTKINMDPGLRRDDGVDGIAA